MKQIVSLLCIILFVFQPIHFTFAQTTNDLQGELQARKSEITSIHDKISDYQKKLEEISRQQSGLKKDIALINNDVKIAELNVEALKLTIDAERIQINILNRQTREMTVRLHKQKNDLRELIVSLQRTKQQTPLEVIFSSTGLHDAVMSLEQLETVSVQLDHELNKSRALRDTLKQKQEEQSSRIVELESMDAELRMRIASLEQKKRASDVLLAQTRNSEERYRAIMRELQQEQQQITSRIVEIQDQIAKRIRQEGGSEVEFDQTTITYPLQSYIVTALFHDPTYPFRNIQEHTGLDLAAPTGTPIIAAAPGIVSWVRPGTTGYGNYVMIIHDNGLATLYAHMSGFAVTQNQYVSRGQVIGYVGSTGFSTGPHLHFEVRLNGVPVNPQSYLQ